MAELKYQAINILELFVFSWINVH